jgi:hypothetical protein
MFTVEKNIPIPESANGRKNLYPFSSMDVGDSFAVPFEAVEKNVVWLQPRAAGRGGQRAKIRNRVTASCTSYAKAAGVKFSTRVIGNLLRVWRVK